MHGLNVYEVGQNFRRSLFSTDGRGTGFGKQCVQGVQQPCVRLAAVLHAQWEDQSSVEAGREIVLCPWTGKRKRRIYDSARCVSACGRSCWRTCAGGTSRHLNHRMRPASAAPSGLDSPTLFSWMIVDEAQTRQYIAIDITGNNTLILLAIISCARCILLCEDNHDDMCALMFL